MRKFLRLLAFCSAPLLMAALESPANASAPSSDIKTGADLVAACHATLGGDSSEAGRVSAAACNQFLAGMVVAVYNATEAGQPTVLHRLGPDGSQSVCFRLPKFLKYQEFAAIAVDYAKSHPELNELPAVELAGRSLADKYPCKE